jgi:hypothetical protein
MKSKKKNTKRKLTKKTRFMLPILAASKKLSKTGSLSKASTAFKKQALFDAKKLFGSVSV